MHLVQNLAIVVTVVSSLSCASAQTLRWAARYDGPGNGYDAPHAIAVDADANVYMTGTSDGGTDSYLDYCTIKYDAIGNQLWVQRYDGPGQGSDTANAIAVDASGNVYVTGESDGGPGTHNDFCTIKYDANGNELWVQRYDGPANDDDSANAIALDPSGNVYVTGFSTGIGTSYDYCTIKYDADGNQIWVQRYDGPGGGNDEATAIAVDGSGNVYVTGYSDGGVATYLDYCTIKYDRNGNQLWVRRYDAGVNGVDLAYAIAVDSTGNVYVTGGSYGGSGTYSDYCTIKYDTTGNQKWVQRYDGPAHDDDSANAIALDASGNAYVTGYAIGSGTFYDYCTVKYDTNGNQMWVRSYDGPAHGDDEANAIALDASGNAYVTGFSDGGPGTRYDYCTIKYNSNGNQVWVQRFDGPGNGDDEAASIAVDVNGNAHVAGYSYNASLDADWLTIMYAGPSATMSGHVDLVGYLGGAGIAGTIDYRSPGTTIPMYASQITLDVNGNYQDTTAPQGTYDLACEFPNWLRQASFGTTIGTSGASASFSLTNGDGNGDNVVNLLDLSLVLSHFGSSGPAPTAGDLNWDGTVNLFDLSIVLAVFGRNGDH